MCTVVGVLFLRHLLHGRYHSQTLKGCTAAAVPFACGGAPAAAVVFPRKVSQLVQQDPRIQKLQQKLKTSSPGASANLREQLNKLESELLLEKRGEIAQQFDTIHSVDRAISVGSLDAVIKPQNLRSAIIKRLQESASD